MTVREIAVLAIGIVMAVWVVWAVWPRSGPRAGPRNNWRQRRGDEVESAKSGSSGDSSSPYEIAREIGGD